MAASLDLRGALLDICNETAFFRNYKINKDSFQSDNAPVHLEFNVYTDGSKVDTRVRAGYGIYKINELVKQGHCRLPDECIFFKQR